MKRPLGFLVVGAAIIIPTAFGMAYLKVNYGGNWPLLAWVAGLIVCVIGVVLSPSSRKE